MKLFVLFLCLMLFSAGAIYALENAAADNAPSKPPAASATGDKKDGAQAKGGETVFVREYKIEGATLLTKQEIDSAFPPPGERTPAEIFAVAEAVTRAYHKKGYIAAYAYVPEQEITDGVVLIRVTEGKIGEISAAGNKHYSTRFIQGHLEKIRKSQFLNEGRLDRTLLLLNDNPSLEARATLRAGKTPGTADIAVTAGDSRPISGSLAYDNYGTKTTSRNRLSLGFSAGNLITSGDDLTLTGLMGLDRINLNRLFYGRVEYLIPVNYNGTRLGVYYSNSVYEAGEEYSILNIYGKAHVAGIYVSHPLIRQKGRTLNIQGGFEYKDIYDYLLDSLRSKDSIRTLHFGASYDFSDRLQGKNIIGITYDQGLGGFLNGTETNDARASRINANGTFAKFAPDITRIQRLTGNHFALLKAQGQITGDNLFTAEQFILGGPGTVRGFSPSSRTGDSGYLLKGELHLLAIERLRLAKDAGAGTPRGFQPAAVRSLAVYAVPFIDHGGVYRNDVQPGEHKDDYLTSLGAGIRLYAGKGFSLKCDWAAPEINGKFDSKNSEIYVQAGMSF